MIDLAKLSEDAVRDLPESDVLDFDDEHDLHLMLVERLNALPYESYLRLCASYLADVRDYLGADAGDEPGLRLLARTIEAASGGPVGSLLNDWNSYARSGNEQHVEYDGGLSMLLFDPCHALAYELTTSTERFGAAEAISESACERTWISPGWRTTWSGRADTVSSARWTRCYSPRASEADHHRCMYNSVRKLCLARRSALAPTAGGFGSFDDRDADDGR